jgi:flagellar biosynthesis regulator FlbT
MGCLPPGSVLSLIQNIKGKRFKQTMYRALCSSRLLYSRSEEQLEAELA